MTTTTTLSIARAAHVGAALVDGAIDAGLAAPTGITARIDWDLATGHREFASISLGEFENVRAWATWLGVEAVERAVYQGGCDVTFIDAHAERDGVTIRLTTNTSAPHVHRHEYTCEQIDAATIIAKCVCGEAIKRWENGPWVAR